MIDEKIHLSSLRGWAENLNWFLNSKKEKSVIFSDLRRRAQWRNEWNWDSILDLQKDYSHKKLGSCISCQEKMSFYYFWLKQSSILNSRLQNPEPRLRKRKIFKDWQIIIVVIKLKDLNHNIYTIIINLLTIII